MERRVGFWGLVLMLMAFLLACGPAATPSPAPATPPKTAATTTAAPAAKPTEAAKPATSPIKIGFMAAMTGSFASLSSDMRDGFLLYLEEKNNTLAGRKVEVIVEDTEGKPDVGLTKAKKLVERDKVNMLAGIVSSAVAAALGDYVKAQKVPLIITNAGDDPLTQQKANPYIFRVSLSNSQVSHPLGEWAYKKGYRKAAILANDFPAGWQIGGGFARTFTEAGGKIIQEIYPPLGTPDFAPYIVTINKDADMLFVFAAGADGLRFVIQYPEFGLKGKIPVFGVSLTSEDILPQQGDAALGIINTHMFFPTIDRPQAKAFVAAYEKRFNKPATQIGEFSYIGGMVIDAALQAVKGNIEDTEGFTKALEKVQLEAPSSSIKFDQYHNVIGDVFFAEVKKADGKLVNAVFERTPQVSQFWKWSPEEFLKMPTYNDLKGKWVK